MLVQQISVFVENKKGKLAEITGILVKKNIDISAISIADTTNFGILRMIVNKPEEAFNAIRDAGYTVSTTEVLAVEVEDRPGGLHQVLEVLDKENINIEYLYSFVRRPCERALILFRVEEIEKSIEVLKKANVKILSREEVYNL